MASTHIEFDRKQSGRNRRAAGTRTQIRKSSGAIGYHARPGDTPAGVVQAVELVARISIFNPLGARS
jgi:hypothetical protein